MTDEDFFEFSQMGSYLELDLFGTECSYYQLNEAFCMPSDGQRIERIRQLVHEGYQDKIVISHDIHTKHRLVSDLISWPVNYYDKMRFFLKAALFLYTFFRIHIWIRVRKLQSNPYQFLDL